MRIKNLIQSNRPYLTDGGLETYMVFEKGFELPCFSAHILHESEAGRQALTAYLERFIKIAKDTGRGFVLDTTTWRLNSAWASPLGMSKAQSLNHTAIAVENARQFRDTHESGQLPIVLNGVVGPAGDGYAPDAVLSTNEALALHVPQVQALGKAGVDLITAMTITHSGEASGIAKAAREIDVPCAISFTVETDGNLPSGETLAEAIEKVDSESGGYPVYFMINCAHPDHFRDAVKNGDQWTRRIGGIRANASRLSHAELDAAEELDPGDPFELGHLYTELLSLLPNIRVVGGCCGTDHRHVGCIAGHGPARRAA